MKINVTFTINPLDSDPDKIRGSFDQYLRDMLYVGAETDTDPYLVDEVEVHLDPTVLVVGDPATGFELIGPVTPNDPALERYTDRELRHTTWWYMGIESLGSTGS